MIYCIKIGGISRLGYSSIGGRDFNFDEGDTYEDIFNYCETTYGLKGEEWERIKNDCDTEALEEILNDIGVHYDEYDDE